LDKTGVKGAFDVNLEWAPGTVRMQPASSDGQPSTREASNKPDFRMALEEQLGLKLVTAKGMVDTLVVDRVEKPSEN
jgi:uncharacterized protein (TIGR03435 family)